MLPENDGFLDKTAGLLGVVASVTSRVGVSGSWSPGEEFRGGVEVVSGVKIASPSVDGAPSDLLTPDTGRLISGSAKSAMVGVSCSMSVVSQIRRSSGILVMWGEITVK